MTSNESECVLLPMKVDAFIFNEAVCSGAAEDAKIAPITQPNYTFLRLKSDLIQDDVLDHIYLGHTSPATANSRYTNLATGKPWPRRQGVYLHWTLPRAYRSGSQSGQAIDAATSYPDTPTRWLVIRTIEKDTVMPVDAKDHIEEVESWVIESDRRSDLDDLDYWVDLQVDVSPFITGDGDEGADIDEQAEVFIGWKVPANEWQEAPSGTYPRVKLSLLNSSNPLFPDYQPHNSNVFSMVDNFSYFDGAGWKTLAAATAHYHVIGWHSIQDADLFNQPHENTSHSELLELLMMRLEDADGKETWLNSKTSIHSVCHGSMYSVKYTASGKPASVPADAATRTLMNDMSIAVGTTPLDSLLAWVSASYAESPSTDDTTVHKLEELLLHIEKLLHAHDDGVDALLEADDQVHNWNYSRIDGGTVFHISAAADGEGSSGEISDEDRKLLLNLNQAQTLVDLAARYLRQARWELFAMWWNAVSDEQPDKEGYAARVSRILQRIKTLEKLRDTEQQSVNDMSSQGNYKKTTHEPFHQQRDPTLLVGGIRSGWPHAFLDLLTVRLESQTVLLSEKLSSSWNDLVSKVLPRLPSGIQGVATSLVKEFVSLLPSSDNAPSTSDDGSIVPLYHDQGLNPTNDNDAPWRDRWNDAQPWFPLFLEWEAEYTHIPFEHWSLEERATRLSRTAKLRAGIREDITLYEKGLDDKRIVSGRSLLLPQATFSLQAKVAQVLKDTPKSTLEEVGISDEDRKLLETSLYQLPFLSSPLSGLNDHLATRSQGAHIKPTNRTADQGVIPIQTAARPEFNIDTEALRDMRLETAPTPYGFLADFRTASQPAFKPVVHGQFRFTQLNIVDKFGQAVHVIDPTPSANGPPPLYPCISEYYEPQLVNNDESRANTVTKDEDGKSQYLQLAMYINQAARLNTTFVELCQGKDEVHETTGHWRPVDPDSQDGPGPVWGWVVLNNADNGLQLFTSDGAFYGEVRFGGNGNASVSPKWLPFSTPATGVDTSLDRLIDKLKDVKYLRAFTGMLMAAQAKLPAPPSAYAQYVNALVGQPIALVYVGFSLELAENAYVSQSSLESSSLSKSRTLLATDEGNERYYFPMKLGDKERGYDGLMGFFNALDTPSLGNEVNLTTFFTYFDGRTDAERVASGTGDPLRMISKDNYINLQAFWLDPLNYVPNSESSASQVAARLFSDRATYLTVVGAILSPFVPLHASISTLPTCKLQLPPWTWQRAMSKMSAFFHLGPIVIPGDVPRYQEKYRLARESDFSKEIDVPESAVPIPNMGVAPWSWLQPYWESSSSQRIEPVQSGESGIAEARTTEYMSLGLSKAVDGRPRFEKGPYTAIEGFLQLKSPLLNESSG